MCTALFAALTEEQAAKAQEIINETFENHMLDDKQIPKALKFVVKILKNIIQKKKKEITLTQYQQLAKNRAADRISTLELLQKYGKGEDKKIKSKNSDRKNKLKINGKNLLEKRTNLRVMNLMSDKTIVGEGNNDKEKELIKTEA
ncbi:hypothetical protein C2G38_2187622 [Gigaspora rosea]|uniref:Uncharacterized protein n=1 Tax=Gigaspora rosea TaxID=44941 RepID=A0A397V7K0_9GLOM|nr:hypothetical protein C2G38_2187622 [Gigaspora rosea]